MTGEVEVAPVVHTPNRIVDEDKQVVILTPMGGSAGHIPIIRLTDSPKRKREEERCAGEWAQDAVVNLTEDGDSEAGGKCSSAKWRSRKDLGKEVILISPDSTEGCPSMYMPASDRRGRCLFLTNVQQAGSAEAAGQEGDGPAERSLTSDNTAEADRPAECSLTSDNTAEQPCTIFEDKHPSEPVIHCRDDLMYTAENPGVLLATAENGSFLMSAADRDRDPSSAVEENGETEVEAVKRSSYLPSKRRRGNHSHVQGPRVEVTYRNLSRKSKRKLEEVLHEWCVWQTANDGAKSATPADQMESGSRVYFPAMQTEQANGETTLHFFWEDRPGVSGDVEQVEMEEGEVEALQSGICGPESAWIAEDRFNVHYEAYYSIPLYDRETNHVISAGRGDGAGNGANYRHHETGKGRDPGLIYLEVPQEAPRCFNCGSYNHSLKECPKPRNNAVISATRQKKLGSRANMKCPPRYHAPSASSNIFGDLKPGVLSERVRQALGMKELDPPPWLNRMRELGYPPGYLDSGNDTSDLAIFDEEGGEDNGDSQGDGGAVDGRHQGESGGSKDGERTSMSTAGKEASQGSRSEPACTVLFPGINAPIPQGADKSKWMLRYHPQQHQLERSDWRQWSPIHAGVVLSTRNQSYGDVVSPQRMLQAPGARGGIQESNRAHVEDSALWSLSSPTIHRSLSDSLVRYPGNGNSFPQAKVVTDISSPRHSTMSQSPFSAWGAAQQSEHTHFPQLSTSQSQQFSNQCQHMSTHSQHLSSLSHHLSDQSSQMSSLSNQISNRSEPTSDTAQMNVGNVGVYQLLHSHQQSYSDHSQEQFSTQTSQNTSFYLPPHLRRAYQSMPPPLTRSLKLPPPVQTSAYSVTAVKSVEPPRGVVESPRGSTGTPRGCTRKTLGGRDSSSDSDMDTGD